MFRRFAMFTLCFSACATTTDPEFTFATQAMPPHADQVHCDSAASFATALARHHVTSDETRDIGDDVSKATDMMARHPGLLADILSTSRCDTATPTQNGAFFDQLSVSYAAVLAASVAPTVDTGRRLWLLGEHLRAGSLMHTAVGATIQEETLHRVLGPALAALPASARAAAIADLRTPPSLAAMANEEALADQLSSPLLPGTYNVVADTWFNELRCRVTLPQLFGDLRALDDLPLAERPAAWAAQHEAHAVCTQFDAPIARALERDVTLIRALEGV